MSSSHPELFALLSRLLIAYTYAFDAALAKELRDTPEHPPSLAMWANVLQFVPDEGLPTKELPSRCGIARSTVRSMVKCLQRHGWIVVDADGVIRLTAHGSEVKRAFPTAKEAVERQWEIRWGAQRFNALRSALEEASKHIDRRLPAYPMPAAHRGGLPAGE